MVHFLIFPVPSRLCVPLLLHAHIIQFHIEYTGLYKPDDDEDNAASTNINDDENDVVVLEDIPLIERTGGNTVINSEKGVKMFVKE